MARPSAAARVSVRPSSPARPLQPKSACRRGRHRRRRRPSHRFLRWSQQVFGHLPVRIINQHGPIRDRQTTGVRRLDFDRPRVRPDQRDFAAGSVRSTRPLDIGEPQPPREQNHDQQCRRDGQAAAGGRRGFVVAAIGGKLDTLPGISRSELIGHGYISSAGSTPITARPEAMTMATPRTRASRARVSAGSAARMNRNVASSRPLFHNM